jgi:hypothetical protein
MPPLRGSSPTNVSITFRKGGGRGAYEITGLRGAGAVPQDILGKPMVLILSRGIKVFTQLRVVESGGKLRFITEHEHISRTAGNVVSAPLAGNEVRVNRQVAAALLLPAPTSYKPNPPVAPLPSRDAYMIWSIIGPLLTIGEHRFVIAPSQLKLRNGTGDVALLPRRRAEEVEAVWTHRARFPTDVSAILEMHRTAINSREPVSDDTCHLVGRLQDAMAGHPGLWPGFAATLDPMPALVEHLRADGLYVGRYEVTNLPTTFTCPQDFAAPTYTPDGTDQRDRVLRSIAERRGQKVFREALRERFGDICLVSGCGVIDALEAAHISPYRGEKENNPSNGLLLRADFHTLFDLDLVGIEPKSLAIQLHPKLKTDYGIYEGGVLKCSKTARPSRAALDVRYQCFLKHASQDGL